MAAAVAALGVVGAAGWVTTRPGPAPQLPPERAIDGYRLVYSAGSDDGLMTEEHLVRRPWLGRITTRRADSSAVVDDLITDRRGLWRLGQGGAPGWYLEDPTPQLSIGDLRTLAALRSAVNEGTAEVVGRGRVAGHACTSVRTGASAGQVFRRGTDEDHTELCLHVTGVPLRRQLVRKGEVIDQRVATVFEPGAPAPEAFATDPEAPSSSEHGLAFGIGLAISDTDQAAIPLRVVPPDGFAPDTPRAVVRREPGDTSRTRAHTRYVYPYHRARDHSGLIVELSAARETPRLVGTPLSAGPHRSAALQLVFGNTIVTVSMAGWTATIYCHDPDVAIETARRLVPE